MLGRKYYATLHISLLKARKHRGEVDDKLRRRVCYDSQVGVVALYAIFGYTKVLYLQFSMPGGEIKFSINY